MSQRAPQKITKEPDLREVLEAYANWSMSPSGSIVLKDLRKKLDVPSYLVGIDALEMAHREGRRSILLDIQAAIALGHQEKSALPEPTNEQETLTF